MSVPDEIGRSKYISLTTYRKDGTEVPTPVWHVLNDGELIIVTEAESWKVKRIRNNPRVRVAICGLRGDIKGPWLDGTASLVEGDDRLAADKLLDRKYFLKKIFNFLTRINRHSRAMIKIATA